MMYYVTSFDPSNNVLQIDQCMIYLWKISFKVNQRKKPIRKNAHQVNPISEKAHQENCPSAKVMGRKIAHQFFKISL